MLKWKQLTLVYFNQEVFFGLVVKEMNGSLYRITILS